MTGELIERWRVGRKVPRNIYRQIGPEPSDNDRDIGRMDTAEDAAVVVHAVNLFFEWQERNKRMRRGTGATFDEVREEEAQR